MRLEDVIVLSEISQFRKRQILNSSTYMTRCLKQPNSQRQKVEWWLPGAAGREEGEVAVQWVELQLHKVKIVLGMDSQQWKCTSHY